MYSLDSRAVFLPEVLISEATRAYLPVEVVGLVDVAGEHGHPLEVQPEALREELLHAHDITREVKLSVRVPRRRHLREIDDCDLFIVIY
jgi:hypothetical protein